MNCLLKLIAFLLGIASLKLLTRLTTVQVNRVYFSKEWFVTSVSPAMLSHFKVCCFPLDLSAGIESILYFANRAPNRLRRSKVTALHRRTPNISPFFPCLWKCDRSVKFVTVRFVNCVTANNARCSCRSPSNHQTVNVIGVKSSGQFTPCENS